MNYLFMEILIYLLIAGVIGFILGWVVKGKCDKSIPEVKEEKAKEKSVDTDISTENKNIPASQKEETSNTDSLSKKINDTERKEDKNIPTLKLLTEAREEGEDDLTLIKGVGKVLKGKLNTLGIYHFDQISSWNKEEQAWVNKYIAFPGKVEREAWVKQAEEFASKN